MSEEMGLNQTTTINQKQELEQKCEQILETLHKAIQDHALENVLDQSLEDINELLTETNIVQSTNTEINQLMDILSVTNAFFDRELKEETLPETPEPPKHTNPKYMPNDGNAHGTQSDKGYTKDNTWRVTTEDSQFVKFTSNNQDMYSQLQKQASKLSHLNKQELSILVVLINNLDEHGFLSDPIDFEELDQEDFVPEIQDVDIEYVKANLDEINKYITFKIKWDNLSKELQQAFAKLRLLRPDGIGLRSQQEYLINIAKNCGKLPEWVIDIFKNHWETLITSNGDYSVIASDIGKTEDEIKTAFKQLPRFYVYPSDYFQASEYNNYDLRIFPRGDGTFTAELTYVPPSQFNSGFLDDFLNLGQAQKKGSKEFKNEQDAENAITDDIAEEINFNDNKDNGHKNIDDEDNDDAFENTDENDNEENGFIKAEVFNHISKDDKTISPDEAHKTIKNKDLVAALKEKIITASKKIKEKKFAKRSTTEGLIALKFMQYLGYRQGLLLHIGKYITEKEQDFLNGKTLFPIQLIQSEYASTIGKDPARICNLLKGKLVKIKTSNGATYVKDLQWFFKKTLEASESIKKIIDAEDKQNPLSDEKISQKLKDEYNITLDRTRISKIRTDCHIPHKNKRKKKYEDEHEL